MARGTFTATVANDKAKTPAGSALTPGGSVLWQGKAGFRGGEPINLKNNCQDFAEREKMWPDAAQMPDPLRVFGSSGALQAAGIARGQDSDSVPRPFRRNTSAA